MENNDDNVWVKDLFLSAVALFRLKLEYRVFENKWLSTVDSEWLPQVQYSRSEKTEV